MLEGGLAGTLIAYGAPAPQTAAAVIVYHAIAFWIPTIGGLVGYALLRRRLDDDRPARIRGPELYPTGDPLSRARQRLLKADQTVFAPG